jgi:hypothetical protein
MRLYLIYPSDWHSFARNDIFPLVGILWRPTRSWEDASRSRVDCLHVSPGAVIYSFDYSSEPLSSILQNVSKDVVDRRCDETGCWPRMYTFSLLSQASFLSCMRDSDFRWRNRTLIGNLILWHAAYVLRLAHVSDSSSAVQ